MTLWRRIRGGHWERWYMNDGFNLVWVSVGRCSQVGDEDSPRPGCLGTPRCEDYPPGGRLARLLGVALPDRP